MHRRGAGRIALMGLVMALMVTAAVATGCSTQSTSMEPATTDKPMEAASQSPMGGDAMPEMTCAMCNKGAPAVEKGAATEEKGVQVVKITLKDGYYSPNEIALKAGVPAKLIFTGEAKDCSGKPKIAQLNKQVDFTGTGEATMDLGTLNPGTYQITCGMDNAGGSLVVK